MRLNFLKQQYGPYAESLNHVLQRLEGQFIRGYGDRSRDASVRILPQAAEEASRFLAGELADQEATLKRITRVRELIEGFETPYGMELLATVHWVAQESGTPEPDTDRVIAEVMAKTQEASVKEGLEDKGVRKALVKTMTSQDQSTNTEISRRRFNSSLVMGVGMLATMLVKNFLDQGLDAGGLTGLDDSGREGLDGVADSGR